MARRETARAFDLSRRDFLVTTGGALAGVAAFGLVGPAETYAPLPEPALWVLSGLMLLGRLELFTVLVLLTRGYWRR